MRRVFAGLLISLTLATTACSGGRDDVLARADDASGRAAFVAGIADGILTADAEQPRPLGLTSADANCISEALVERLGVERLVELGVTNDTASSFTGAELVDADRLHLADAYLGCVSLDEAVAQSMVDSGISHESAVCFGASITENPKFIESFKTMLIDGTDIDTALTSDPALLGEVFAAMQGCLSTEELQLLVGG